MQNFEEMFTQITGHKPFPWQKRLYEQFCRGDMPATCDIPTGLGKTSVIAVWLLALVGRDAGVQLPRRLVYVVNRRTIVDQSTEVVIELCKRLKEAEQDISSSLNGVVKTLKDMCAVGNSDGDLLSISTLRGELADNLQWRFDPMKPTVIIGTVDMIGSKLLFSGYGDTRRTKPLNAGLIGCDTLIVHDEAHLTPAFSLLLRSVEDFQNKVNEVPGIPPFRILELSATSRQAGSSSFQIDDTDYSHKEINKRLYAKKTLYLHEIATPGELTEKIVSLAFNHNDDKTRVVVFVQSPEEAVNVHKLLVECLCKKAEEKWCKENNTARISKKEKDTLENRCKENVSILTGEIRGYERDKLLNNTGMLPFAGKNSPEQTVYLVSTSAGEVGMDLHADHMVSDLSTLDSMIQRLGRVNRFGQTEAQVDVVYGAALSEKDTKGEKEENRETEEEDTTRWQEEGEKKKDKNKNPAQQKTLALLKNKMAAEKTDSGTDASPAALLELLKEKEAAEAFTPVPEALDTTDILLDLWAQTSLMDIPARPEVAPWLHGIQENLPETWLAWRHEIALLCDSDLTEDDISRWFQKFPILSKETLRKPTYRLKWTGAAEKKWIESHGDWPIFVLLANGQGRKMTIADMAKQGKRLNFATIVFPLKLGGLNDSGFFDIKVETPTQDVADHTVQRIVLEKWNDQYRFVPLAEWTSSTPGGTEDSDNKSGWQPWTTVKDAIRVAEIKSRKKAVFKLKVRQANEWEDNLHEWWLVLLKEARTENGDARVRVPTIDEHNLAVANIIRLICEKTVLPAGIKEALILAAVHHDLGKAYERWQTAAGHGPAAGLAKPVSGGIDWRILDGYRHELGSLLKALEVGKIKSHTEHELIHHLIATHHGWARPHFEDRAFPPEVDAETRNRINLDIMKRYISLQERFGYWQLAWLESLFRRADGIASMQQGEYEEASDE
jgi:CRISPR-associated endonuclease/helicase Cas3